MAAPGILFALTSALLFGASTPIGNCCWACSIPGCRRVGFILARALGWLCCRGRRLIGCSAAETPLRLADLPWLVGVVLAGGVIGPVLLMIGLNRRLIRGASPSLISASASVAAFALGSPRLGCAGSAPAAE
jgi:hypothetical protein